MQKSFLIKALENFGPVRKGDSYVAYEANDDMIQIYIQSFEKVNMTTAFKNSFAYEILEPKAITEEMILETLSGKKLHLELTDPSYFTDKLHVKISYSLDGFYSLINSLGEEISITQSTLLSNLAKLYLLATKEGEQVMNDLKCLNDPYLLNTNTKIYAFLEGVSLYLTYKNEFRISKESLLNEFNNYLKIDDIEKFDIEKMTPIFKSFFDFLGQTFKNMK